MVFIDQLCTEKQLCGVCSKPAIILIIIIIGPRWLALLGGALRVEGPKNFVFPCVVELTVDRKVGTLAVRFEEGLPDGGDDGFDPSQRRVICTGVPVDGPLCVCAATYSHDTNISILSITSDSTIEVPVVVPASDAAPTVIGDQQPGGGDRGTAPPSRSGSMTFAPIVFDPVYSGLDPEKQTINLTHHSSPASTKNAVATVLCRVVYSPLLPC